MVRQTTLPFSFLPLSIGERISRKLLTPAKYVGRFLPKLSLELVQANFPYKMEEYVALGITSAVANALLIFTLFAVIMQLSGRDLVVPALVGAVVIFGATFFNIVNLPHVRAWRRMRYLEANLIPSLRQLQIELESGVPLFKAITTLEHGYGEVSSEFTNIVKAINIGRSESQALAEASKRNPSFRFRRALWQISNSLTTGSNVANDLNDTINELRKEQVYEIRAYGQELNPFIMMYMMASVVVPSLGIALAGILLTFINIRLPKYIYGLVLILIPVFQVTFINFVQSRRPLIE